MKTTETRGILGALVQGGVLEPGLQVVRNHDTAIVKRILKPCDWLPTKAYNSIAADLRSDVYPSRVGIGTYQRRSSTSLLDGEIMPMERHERESIRMAESTSRRKEGEQWDSFVCTALPHR